MSTPTKNKEKRAFYGPEADSEEPTAHTANQRRLQSRSLNLSSISQPRSSFQGQTQKNLNYEENDIIEDTNHAFHSQIISRRPHLHQNSSSEPSETESRKNSKHTFSTLVDPSRDTKARLSSSIDHILGSSKLSMSQIEVSTQKMSKVEDYYISLPKIKKRPNRISRGVEEDARELEIGKDGRFSRRMIYFKKKFDGERNSRQGQYAREKKLRGFLMHPRSTDCSSVRAISSSKTRFNESPYLRGSAWPAGCTKRSDAHSRTLYNDLIAKISKNFQKSKEKEKEPKKRNLTNLRFFDTKRAETVNNIENRLQEDTFPYLSFNETELKAFSLRKLKNQKKLDAEDHLTTLIEFEVDQRVSRNPQRPAGATHATIRRRVKSELANSFKKAKKGNIFNLNAKNGRKKAPLAPRGLDHFSRYQQKRRDFKCWFQFHKNPRINTEISGYYKKRHKLIAGEILGNRSFGGRRVGGDSSHHVRNRFFGEIRRRRLQTLSKKPKNEYFGETNKTDFEGVADSLREEASSRKVNKAPSKLRKRPRGPKKLKIRTGKGIIEKTQKSLMKVKGAGIRDLDNLESFNQALKRQGSTLKFRNRWESFQSSKHSIIDLVNGRDRQVSNFKKKR